MKSMKKYGKGGKKFPDLTGDGKVTFADVLKGRGVKKAKKGMRYEDGDRPADRAANILDRRSKRQAKKSERSMKREVELQAKADAIPNGIENVSRRNQVKKAILEERARTRGNIGRAQSARAERSAKASKALRRRSEIAAANRKNRSAKAEIRSKYRK